MAQDGRVMLGAFMAGLGVVWRSLLVGSEARAKTRALGIIPLLTRLELEGTDGPFAVDAPLAVRGGYASAHTLDERGQVSRILLEMDAEIHGPLGRTHLAPPEGAGTEALVGRVRAEHVFTKPFAPPEERKVVALPFDGGYVPPLRREFRRPITVLEPPEGARALDADFVADPAGLTFGLAHTDSNQHVNSLVYPRLFEEAALRRIAANGRPFAVLARSLEVAFRRPSFAGETLSLGVRLYEHDGRIVATGAFFGPESRELSRARVFVRTTFG